MGDAMRRYPLIALVLTSTVAFLVGLILAGGVPRGFVTPRVSGAQRTTATVRSSSKGAPLPSAAVNFADVAERINPAVVNIDAASRAGHETHRHRGADDPDAPRDFDVPHQGSGSGFIIDRDGYVLTNFHVIEDADRITVTLADGRVVRGEIVGIDPAIDVALLRVSTGGPLPEAPLGNSDDLRVGEWVCAIGNPLGYVHSVTVGVVSFIGRKLFDASLDDYIQTDAAINFGNSGGPLLNARGQVVGINSAISSRATNIGFAVPINQAVAILPQLKTRGSVSRGFIGVMLTDVTPDLQHSLKLPASRGALVQDISRDSPAERAGLKPYDVIVGVDGREVWTNEELIREISGRQPGSVAHLDVMREGRKQQTSVRLTERPLRERDTDEAPVGMQPRRHASPVPGDPPLGLTVRDLDAAFARRMEIPASVRGVVVSRVDPAGAAFVPAMRRGFVIMEINRQAVVSGADFQRIVGAARAGDTLAFYGYDPSVGQRAFVTATVDAR
jgi:serine protease Do